LARDQVEAILASIPKTQECERLMFRLLLETDVRISEALGCQVEDLDVRRNDEHLRVREKGGQTHTIHPHLAARLRSYLRHTDYPHGHLFRTEKNGDGQPWRYQRIQERRAGYCRAAGILWTLH